MNPLTQRRCAPCEGGVPALDLAASRALLAQLQPCWRLEREGQALVAEFEFKNYWHTTAFVNAVAWVAHREDHHPDIAFGYRRCTVTWWTHAVNGLSENDFICAAKVDALLIEGGNAPA